MLARSTISSAVRSVPNGYSLKNPAARGRANALFQLLRQIRSIALRMR